MNYNPLIEYIDVGADGKYYVEKLPQEQAIENLARVFDQALTNLYDEVAKTKQYESRITCALRAGYDGYFKAEGVAFAQWMDSCNVIAYAKMQEVADGKSPPPKSIEDFIESLPKIQWPDQN